MIYFKRLPTNRNIIGFVFPLFIILCLVSIMKHEMWRDEMDVWLIAKDTSFNTIFGAIKAQGHPALWFLVVKVVQQFFISPFGMALANLFFISLAVLLLLKYSPLGQLQSVLLTFSYFIFYEYGTISRNYAMSLFFIFAVCALYPKRQRHIILIAILLAISCSIHSMNLIFAFCFAFLFASEYIFAAESTASTRPPKLHLFIAGLVLAVGTILALYQALPSKDSPWALSSAHSWVFHSPLRALSSIWKAFVPISSPGIHFWNTNILPDGLIMILMSLIILIISSALFFRKFIICCFYLLGITSFIIFFTKVYHGFTRHHGFLFVIFLVTYWISFYHADSTRDNVLTRLSRVFLNKKFNFFTFICFIQFISLSVPLYFDWLYPFSESRAVSKYLTKNNLQDCVLLGDKDYSVAPVAGWLDREMYYPAIDDFGKAVDWNNPNRKSMPLEDIRQNIAYHNAIKQKAEKLARQRNKDVVLILNYPLDETPLKQFATSIVPDETYYIYRVNSPQ